MPVVLVLDAGTGGAKCSVVDHSGAVRATAAERWEYEVVANALVPMVREYAFDPDRFWQTIGRCARRALSQAATEEVVGVVTTSQREGCVFLDDAGKEVYAGPNLDSRAFMEGLRILEELGASRLYQITGHTAPFIFPLARYLWFRANDERPLSKLLMINDWMIYRACGEIVSEPSNATESMIFDFRERQWSEEVCRLFEVDPAALAPIHPNGSVVGALSPTAAVDLGLPEGTPIYTGGADTQCGLLGVGATTPGDVAVTLGTTSPVQCVVAEPCLDPAENLWAGCHVLPASWVLESNAGSTGDAYEWLVGLTIGTDEGRHERALTAAQAAAPFEGFSYIGPRIFDINKTRPDLPGALFFPFPALQLRPGPGELVRSLIESVACAVRANLEQLERVVGSFDATLAVGGGMSRSPLLVQTVADVLGRPIRLADTAESTAVGCAALTFAGSSFYAGVAEAAGAMCRSTEITPDPESREAAEAGYAKWRGVYDVLDGMSI